MWPVLGRWEAESATEEGLEMWAWASLPAATVHQAQLLKSFCRVADLSLDGRGQRRRDGEVQPPGLCRPFKKLHSEGQWRRKWRTRGRWGQAGSDRGRSLGICQELYLLIQASPRGTETGTLSFQVGRTEARKDGGHMAEWRAEILHRQPDWNVLLERDTKTAGFSAAGKFQQVCCTKGQD